MRNFLILIFTFFFLSVFAVTFERTYGRPGFDDWAETVQQTEDGGYIIGGTTTFESAIYWCSYPIKTDSLGDTIWSNSDSLHTGNIREILLTPDKGFLALASNLVSNHIKFEFVKYDSSGNRLWAKNYGGALDDEPFDLCQTSDGNYLGLGITKSYGSGGWDVWLVKFDPLGNMLWDKTYGGVDDDFGYAISPSADHGFIIIGGTYSWGSGLQDVYLVKIDSSGNLLWSKTYGGLEEDIGMAVKQTADGGYIIAGATYSYGAGNNDVYLIRTDSLGDTLWTRTYGGPLWDGALDLCQSADGCFVIVGETMSYGSGLTDVYLIKVDPNGNLIWSRTYGGVDADRGWAIRPTDDGGFIIAGRTRLPTSNYYDIYLIKTDHQGNIGITEEKELTLKTIQVYPNPSSGRINVVLDTKLEDIKLFDASGRLIERVKPASRFSLTLPAGIYFLKIKSRHRIITEKIVIIR